VAAGAETFQYDTLGRLVGHTSDLGAFTLGYLGQTGQVVSRQRASSTLATTWSYLNNLGDRRLAGIANTGLTAGQFSNFAFATTPEDFISSVTETADTAAVYPRPAPKSRSVRLSPPRLARRWRLIPPARGRSARATRWAPGPTTGETRG